MTCTSMYVLNNLKIKREIMVSFNSISSLTFLNETYWNINITTVLRKLKLIVDQFIYST